MNQVLLVCLEETVSLVLRGHRAHRVSEAQWDQLGSRGQGDCQDQWGLRDHLDHQDNQDNQDNQHNHGFQLRFLEFLWGLSLCRMRQ